MKIAIDMDEVLADTQAAILEILGRRGYAFSESDLRGHRAEELADPADRRDIKAILDEGHIFGTLAPMPGAIEGVQALREAGHDIWIATAAFDHPGSFTPKYHWLLRHVPFLDFRQILFCGDKSIVAADVLIDDSPHHFERFGGTGIVFSATHNLDNPHTPRADDWDAIPDLVRHVEKERAT